MFLFIILKQSIPEKKIIFLNLNTNNYKIHTSKYLQIFKYDSRGTTLKNTIFSLKIANVFMEFKNITCPQSADKKMNYRWKYFNKTSNKANKTILFVYCSTLMGNELIF